MALVRFGTITTKVITRKINSKIILLETINFVILTRSTLHFGQRKITKLIASGESFRFGSVTDRADGSSGSGFRFRLFVSGNKVFSATILLKTETDGSGSGFGS